MNDSMGLKKKSNGALRRSALITGSTGFVGSSFAARLLKDGHRVLALSRNDPKGLKTRSAIERASETLGFKLPESVLKDDLTVVSGDISNAAEALTDDLLLDIDSVWHFAATLSYNIARLSQSMDVNVASTTELYRLLNAKSPHCRRFYHCSTAYTVGLPLDGENVLEELHDSPRNPNVYQLSKWAAEMSLRALSVDSRLPVTILRPAIVTGHSQTGLYHGDAFGVYMFFYATHKFLARMGLNHLRLAPEIKGSVNLVPVDVFVENSVNLDAWASSEQKHFEVIHFTGDAVPTEMLAVASERSNKQIKVTFDGPHSTIDHMFASAVEENRIFVAHKFHFEEKRLAQILGDKVVKPNLINESALVSMMNSYFDRLDNEKDGREIPPLLRLTLPWLSKASGSVASTLAKVIAEQQRRSRIRNRKRALRPSLAV